MDWSDVIRRFKDLRSLIDTKPVFRWGVITNEDPLLVQLDGDDRPIAGSPSTIIGGLAAGERVLCLIQNRRVTVLGRGGDEGSKTLFTGGQYLTASQVAELSEPVSAQQNGIILAWVGYSNGNVENASWNFVHVPKQNVAVNPGAGVSCVLARGYNTTTAAKYVYVHDNRVNGHAFNDTSPNNQFVLRHVFSY